MRTYKNWRFKNTAILVLSLIVFFYLLNFPFVKNLISSIGGLGYLGAFISGMFFVSTFTVAPSTVILFYLAEKFNAWDIAILAGLGAVIGDFIIFKFLKDRVFEELKPIFQKTLGKKISNLYKTPYFGWTAMALGAIIIASPFPDEVGLSLMGLSKIKTWQFLLFSFTLNAIGIFIIILLAQNF